MLRAAFIANARNVELFTKKVMEEVSTEALTTFDSAAFTGAHREFVNVQKEVKKFVDDNVKNKDETFTLVPEQGVIHLMATLFGSEDFTWW